ncbi:STAS domain-containing protein [Streptomyces sp. NPDC048606]|uniref:STAS domain-containing protein n=1 Tax=Streptomyces sp. NPDC048606 TaxID=3154726 RepID=UPI00343FAF2A
MPVRLDVVSAGAYVIHCAGEFDQDTVPDLTGVVAAVRDRAGAGRLVVDVRDVTFADSAFLNCLLGLRAAGELVLVGPLPAQLRRLLEITGALTLFTLAPSVRAAHGGPDPSVPA